VERPAADALGSLQGADARHPTILLARALIVALLL